MPRIVVSGFPRRNESVPPSAVVWCWTRLHAVLGAHDDLQLYRICLFIVRCKLWTS